MASVTEGQDSTSEQESTTSSDSTPTNRSSMIDVNGTQIILDTPTLKEILSGRSDCEMLGRGTYGKVYKYTCPTTNTTVAIKHLFSAKLRRCQPIAEKFQRELLVHKDLDQKNIVQFITSIRDDEVGLDGALVLVLEFAEKGSLHDLMKRGMLERCKILLHIAQILKGLSYLHNFKDNQGERRPIIHRDLRCANVLVSGDNTLKIADFGLCKRLHDMARASGINSRMGNPFWYAPELVDKSKRIGRSINTLALTDIWSLGVLILELYYYGAYRVPFIDHYREFEYIFKLGNGWVPKTPKAAPYEIKILLDKCLEYCVDKRAPAVQLLKIIDNFDLTKRANLEISEPINPPLVLESSSSSENTPESYVTITETISDGFGSDTYVAPEKTLEPEQIDPLEDPDSKYLTLRFDRKLELIRRNMEDPQISRLTDESVHLISFESKEKEEFTLEDLYQRNGTYVVKKKDTEEEVFRVAFDDQGKLLTVRQRQKEIFSIDTPEATKGYLSTPIKGGIAQLNQYSHLKKKISKKRMKIKSVTLEGARMLDAMSPTMNRAFPPTATPVQLTPTSQIHRSTTSLMSIRYDNRSLAIKKNEQPSQYYYKIQFREDKAVMANFSTFLDEGKCEMCVMPDSNSALVATVVAYYYRTKSKRKRSKLKNLFNFSWARSNSYGQMSDS